MQAFSNRTLKKSESIICKNYKTVPVFSVIIITAAIWTAGLSKPCSASAFEQTAVAAAAQQVYTVVKGDSLWSISQKFSVTVNDIMTANNMQNSVIYPGQMLKIPTAASKPGLQFIKYKIPAGSTLGQIAEYFGTTVADIRSLNNIWNDAIYAGQIISVPATYIDYRVVWGDTLYKIAQKFGTTVDKIRLFNMLSNDLIYSGSILHIPHVPDTSTTSYITHTVTSGENVWSISIKYGVPQQELFKLNGLNESSMLSIGQKIKIPVHHVPVKATPGPQYGEYLDWWSEAQYVFPIGKTAIVRDFVTGKSFRIKRTIGANHADCEPLTASDTEVIKELWGGNLSWVTRAVIVEVDGRKIAASMASMPHGIEYEGNNNFNGHFDIHFRGSTRHVDGAVDNAHQAKIKISAGFILD